MQAKVLSQKKQLVHDILSSKKQDRIATLYTDIELYSKESTKESDKFYLFDFNGPFQNLSSNLGLEDALCQFVKEPRKTSSVFKQYLLDIIEQYRSLKHKGFEFDGIWIWEDIAYDNGLYFSIEKYRQQLIGVHKDICDFFTSEELPIFFHCDGNIEKLIPLLVAIEVGAIHPLQEKVNPNLLKIKEIFKEVLTCVGGVGLDRLNCDADELLECIQSLQKDGDYIFSFDGPIPDGFDKKRFSQLIDNITNMEFIA